MSHVVGNPSIPSAFPVPGTMDVCGRVYAFLLVDADNDLMETNEQENNAVNIPLVIVCPNGEIFGYKIFAIDIM